MMAEKGSTERARRRGDEETGDRRPETGDRRQETGDRRPETGDRRQETGDRRPETGDRRPEKRRREEQEYSDQWREDVGKMMNQKRERRSII
jgi:hypothetical protein